MRELDTDAIVLRALDAAQRELMERPLHSEIILNQLLKAIPDYSKAIQLLSIVKQKTGEFEEAVKLATRATELEPENSDNYNNLALAYANLEKFDKSIEYMNKAMELSPGNYTYISNLALQYRQIGQHDMAISLFRKALEIISAPELWANLGGVYGEMKELDNAVFCFNKALEVDSNLTAAHVDLSFAYHLQGMWEKGFQEYEWRFDYFRQLSYYKNAYNQGKKWDGKASLDGKRILLYGEQGLGDQIHFVRYCKILKERGAHVIVHCSELLAAMFKRIPFVDDILVMDIVNGKNLDFPIYDYQCSLMSLPALLGMGVYSAGNYITPVVEFNAKNYDYKDTFNIGICWAGSAAHPHDQARSTYLKHFQGIHDIPGVQLFNLQMCPTKRMFLNGKKVIDFAEGGEKIKLIDMTPLIQNFEDSATVISGLDLIITVDTALVHLAGAMGVPCWMMLPYNCDWRWKLTGNTTEWYDSVRIFRQPDFNDWESVFTEMEKNVKTILSDK